MAKKALCIGINDYPGTQNDLSGCVNDANDWTAVLSGRGFDITNLLDAQATKAKMVSAIRALVDEAVRGDSYASRPVIPFRFAVSVCLASREQDLEFIVPRLKVSLEQ